MSVRVRPEVGWERSEQHAWYPCPADTVLSTYYVLGIQKWTACSQCPHGAGESEMRRQETNDLLRVKPEGPEDGVARFNKLKYRMPS